MISKTHQPETVKAGSTALSRRQLINASISGVVVAMVAVSTPCIAASVSKTYSFGSGYTIREVSRVGCYTHVELGFQVNGVAFTTHVRSRDERTWYPV